MCKVKCPVQMSGSGVRLIFRSMSGSVQLKNLGFKSLTSEEGTPRSKKNKSFKVNAEVEGICLGPLLTSPASINVVLSGVSLF